MELGKGVPGLRNCFGRQVANELSQLKPMSRSIKLSLIVIALAALTIFSFLAASDNFFFRTLDMTYADTFEERNGSYELDFYAYGNADIESSLIVATVFYKIEQNSENIAHIMLQISPIDRFKVYSMNLDVKGFQPASALILENPETGQSLPFVYTRTDNALSVTLDFPDLHLDYAESITIDFWLDLPDIKPVAEDHLFLDISFSVHDKSAFKIVKYVSDFAIKLDIPFFVQ